MTELVIYDCVTSIHAISACLTVWWLPCQWCQHAMLWLWQLQTKLSYTTWLSATSRESSKELHFIPIYSICMTSTQNDQDFYTSSCSCRSLATFHTAKWLPRPSYRSLVGSGCIVPVYLRCPVWGGPRHVGPVSLLLLMNPVLEMMTSPCWNRRTRYCIYIFSVIWHYADQNNIPVSDLYVQNRVGRSRIFFFNF